MLTHENASWLKEVSFSAPESLAATTRTGQEIQVLAAEASSFRSVEEISGRVSAARRSAGRLE